LDSSDNKYKKYFPKKLDPNAGTEIILNYFRKTLHTGFQHLSFDFEIDPDCTHSHGSLKDKSFLFGCAGRASLFVTIYPSNYRKEV
jgi:hypothetical protein